jgi:hypothetical protein
MELVAAIESIAIVMSALLPAVLGRMKRIGAADAVKLHSWAVVYRVQSCAHCTRKLTQQ